MKRNHFCLPNCWIIVSALLLTEDLSYTVQLQRQVLQKVFPYCNHDASACSKTLTMIQILDPLFSLHPMASMHQSSDDYNVQIHWNIPNFLVVLIECKAGYRHETRLWRNSGGCYVLSALVSFCNGYCNYKNNEKQYNTSQNEPPLCPSTGITLGYGVWCCIFFLMICRFTAFHVSFHVIK